jgi:hypothetical protein
MTLKALIADEEDSKDGYPTAKHNAGVKAMAAFNN